MKLIVTVENDIEQVFLHEDNEHEQMLDVVEDQREQLQVRKNNYTFTYFI